MGKKMPRTRAAGQVKNEDQHLTQPFSLRLSPEIWEQIDKLCRLKGSKRSEEIRRMIVEKLTDVGLWPPGEKPK